MFGYPRDIPIFMAVSTFLSAYGSLFMPDQSTAAELGKTILVMPNVDDDDLDGKRDCDDGAVNGPFDIEDLTWLEIPFRVVQNDVEISGAGRNLFNVVSVEPTHSGGSKFYIEAKGPRTTASSATITAKAGGRKRSFLVDVRPFLLTSSLQRATTVFVVEFPTSKTLVSTLKRLFFAETFLGKNKAVLSVGNPLPNRKWIDWFGNLEVTPPYVAQDGRSFSKGRILTGKQGELTMHDSVMQFLENQGVQWPPIVLDTGFLMIGHIDEIVNFVPTKDGFKVLLASPTKGRQLIEKLARQGYGDSKLLVGKSVENGTKAEISVDEILQNRELTLANANAERVMEKNRLRLKQELGIGDEHIIELPLMFKSDGWALWPNVVNGLVLEHHFISPKPFGPQIGNTDAIEAACREALAGSDVTVHFLNAFEAYSSHAGEVHCGTNAVRSASTIITKSNR